VAECDPTFDEHTRTAWQEVLESMSEKMHEGAVTTLRAGLSLRLLGRTRPAPVR